jgi:hypothetical protein
MEAMNTQATNTVTWAYVWIAVGLLAELEVHRCNTISVVTEIVIQTRVWTNRAASTEDRTKRMNLVSH